MWVSDSIFYFLILTDKSTDRFKGPGGIFFLKVNKDLPRFTVEN